MHNVRRAICLAGRPVHAAEHGEGRARSPQVSETPPPAFGFDQRAARPGPVTAEMRGKAQLFEQGQASFLVSRPPEPERRLIASHRFVEAHALGRQIARCHRIATSFFADLGTGIMSGEHFQGRGIAGRARFERGRYAPVQLLALAKQERLIRDLLDQGMLERPLVGRWRHQELGPGQGLEG